MADVTGKVKIQIEHEGGAGRQMARDLKPAVDTTKQMEAQLKALGRVERELVRINNRAVQERINAYKKEQAAIAKRNAAASGGGGSLLKFGAKNASRLNTAANVSHFAFDALGRVGEQQDPDSFLNRALRVSEPAVAGAFTGGLVGGPIGAIGGAAIGLTTGLVNEANRPSAAQEEAARHQAKAARDLADAAKALTALTRFRADAAEIGVGGGAQFGALDAEIERFREAISAGIVSGLAERPETGSTRDIDQRLIGSLKQAFLEAMIEREFPIAAGRENNDPAVLELLSSFGVDVKSRLDALETATKEEFLSAYSAHLGVIQ